ncbi:MAG: hypothetical protein BHW64_01370 [Candidatus Melainabacteria bacterium LEY3_CP_29_8]|nr:MAG: hypothetical protein BHW64_01370 [Candidatus Melainabacteria bacterium LEY3_CP_29_8]
MKYYIIEDITCSIGDYNSHILVKATNKKDALEKMWIALGYDNQKDDIKNGYKPHYKKEFSIKDIDSWFNEMKFNNLVAVIH